MLKYEKVLFAIETAKKKLETLDPDKKRDLDSSFKELSIRELVSYQQLKSVAFASGKIDLETANYLYRSLGDWNSLPLEDRVIITQLIAAFLGSTAKTQNP